MGLRYGSGRIGLRALDLTIDAGEVVAILGPNGSGKSTLLRLLATDLRATEGTLSLLGRPVRGSLARLRRGIGYAADVPVHFEVLTGAENALAFQTLVPPDRDVSGLPPGEAESSPGIEDLLEEFDLTDVSDTPVSEYSFGMSRKLLLLETLAQAPLLLLLDEPSVGLDPRGMSALRNAVQTLRSEGRTVIVASNEIREIPLWADRVLFLNRGEVVEDAPLPVLLDRLTGRTRIEIELGDSSSADLGVNLSEIDGVEAVKVDSGGVVVESSNGGRPLPALAGALLSAGREVRDIHVREPDLGDLFLTLTGESLRGVSEALPHPEAEKP